MNKSRLPQPLRALAKTALPLLAAALVTNEASAQNNANANAAYSGYLSAFLVQNGSTAYFCNGLSDRSVAFMWGDAYMITGVEDAYDRNPSAASQQLISNLLNTFIANNGTSWSWDSWNDDCAWADIAFIRGYIITGNTAYLNDATANWNMVWNRSWDTSLGGGIWENTSNQTKAALSNDPMIIAGCYIYQSTGDSGYLTKCEQIYTWVRNNLLNTSVGNVNEALTSSGGLQSSDNAYNDGAFVNAADALYKITGTSQDYNDALLAANHLKNVFTPLYSPSGGSWADQAVRGVSRFARDNNLWSTYLPWLTSNCNAAWNNRRTDYNITWNNWEQPTTTVNSNTFGMDCLSAMVIQMVSQIDQKVGTHAIINQANGLAIDNGSSSAQNAGMIQWGPNGGLAQQWRFTQNSDTSWNITSVYSGQALDDPGSSTANGTQMIQWPENFGSNQKWWVDQQSNGNWKIWNQASSAALDDDSKTTNGTPLIQWTWQNAANQYWIIK